MDMFNDYCSRCGEYMEYSIADLLDDDRVECSECGHWSKPCTLCDAYCRCSVNCDDTLNRALRLALSVAAVAS